MSFEKIISCAYFQNLSQAYGKKIRTVGIMRESTAFLFSLLAKETERDILIIASNEKRAKELRRDFISLGHSVILWEKKERLLYAVDAASSERIFGRVGALRSVITLSDEPKVIISTSQAISQPIMPIESFKSAILKLSSGDEKKISFIRSRLEFMGYESAERVEGEGQYSIRGGIVDIACPFSDETSAVRIEFFDDEIDSIRTFNIETQLSERKLEEVSIYPAKEWLFSREEKIEISKKIRPLMKNALEVLSKSDVEAASLCEEKFSTLIEKLEENLYLDNADLLLPFLENFERFTDCLSDDTLVYFEDILRVSEDEEEFRREIGEELAELTLKGEWITGMNYPDLAFEKMLEKLKNKTVIYNSDFTQSIKIEFEEIQNWNIRSATHFNRNWDLFFEELKTYRANDFSVMVFSGTKERSNLLIEKIKSEELFGNYISVLNSSLSEGFVFSDFKCAIFTERELFETNKRKREKSSGENAKEYLSFKDLKVGEFVVHENYGIAVYEGVKTLESCGIKKDYLSLSYHGSEKLYVPIEQLHWIQKYIGNDETKPKVTKLSGGDWKKKTAKVKRAVEEMAEDLILLYAKRSNRKGYSFSKDQAWQKDFEDAFPYGETSGQLRAVSEIKQDMESSKSMDRLLCGDVGYGKTEVALRAAFKAISDSKQVALLAPTTILTEQHFNTIMERFQGFPITCEVLNRFRSAKEQKSTIKKIKQGVVDLAVGTHRLLSKDVEFKDLGLLIIDEEQRFGVRQKEELKKLKENVDVLTLSATPIPRTLHLSLSGIRDISLLDEPPENRFPIQTYVTEYRPELVRSAILKEIERDGQVYYVYNKVESISQKTSMLKDLVPEARFRYAHGKMSGKELENEMSDFLHREFDVLVCTTIIETGLDIPNVNTIIVEDSDRFGLSQLYQLRGRVGRSERIAFCFMTYQKQKVLTEIASKRLRAIKEFTRFGSGYQIALRDLQIRGAGNLLGVSQHGNMAEIGYDLYVKFLNRAIKENSGEKVEDELEVSVDFEYNAFLPKDYIESELFRMEIYKKISSLESEEDKLELIDELIDRFGEPKSSVINLMDISIIRSLSEKIGIRQIKQKGNRLSAEFYEKELNTGLYNSILSLYKPRLDYNPLKGALSLILEGGLSEVKEFLRTFYDLKKSCEV